jgi:hypothetical protein
MVLLAEYLGMEFVKLLVSPGDMWRRITQFVTGYRQKS